MNKAAAGVIVSGFLKGAFDVFDAMLSRNFEFETQDAAELDANALDSLLGEFAVAMRGKIQNDLGTGVLLFSTGTATQFAALLQDADPEPRDALNDEDRAMLGEVTEPAVGGGVTNLMERFERPVEQLDEAVLSEDGPASAQAILDLLGPGAVATRFSFNGGDGLSGEGALLYSASLEELVPEALLREQPAQNLAGKATLSPDEMTDILSGFDSEEEEPESGAPAGAGARGGAATPTPKNLDMVLDIQLEATARLGRVEMPIGDILNLGPGSIVEVGHMVDEPVELLINGKLVARGDVVVIDEKFGLRITEILSPQGRIESLR